MGYLLITGMGLEPPYNTEDTASEAYSRTIYLRRPDGMIMLERVFNSLDFSARAYDKILRVSRTIADLQGCPTIEAEHVLQAVQYRSLDRKLWQK